MSGYVGVITCKRSWVIHEVIDIGSGDGRIAFCAKDFGFGIIQHRN